MSDEENDVPKAGGVKAMLAALQKKNLDSQPTESSVPKRSWKPQPKKDNAATEKPPAAPQGTPQGTPQTEPSPSPTMGPGPSSQSGTGSLTQDELSRVRAEIAAAPGGRGGVLEEFTFRLLNTHLCIFD